MIERQYQEELEENVREFARQLPSLLQHRGKFAVGRAGVSFSCWDSYEDALKTGYSMFGLRSFVVLPVEDSPRLGYVERDLGSKTRGPQSL